MVRPTVTFMTMSEPSGGGTTPRLRGALGGVPGYVPGRAARTRPGLTAFKVSSNENPYPPLPSVLDAASRAAATMNRYPDMAVTTLTERLARHLGVPAARVVTGPGSVGVLKQVVEAACDPGDEVVFAWRSFEAYPILVALAGGRSIQVPLAPGARHDLPAMAEAVTDRTRVVIVCTPNNPTGPSVRHDALAAFLDAVPSDVLVVLDEAYLEFVETLDAPDCLALHREHANVVVLRTFSKAYGLAGLRVGYAVAHEPVAEALRKTAIPFGVNTVAQVAAVASLDAGDELEVRVKEIVAERARVVEALTLQGWDIPDTDANFVWLPVGAQTADFVAACAQAGLMIRGYGDDGARVTIGEPEANERLIDVCAAWRSRTT